MTAARCVLSGLFLAAACSDASVRQLNSPPTALITSHDGGESLAAGSETSLRGVVGDANHALDSLGVTWLLDGEPVCENASLDADGVIECTVVPQAPQAEVILEVRDPVGAAASDRRTFTVEADSPPDNRLPECRIDEPTDETVAREGDPLLFRGAVTDPDQPPESLDVRWYSDLDGNLGTSTPGPTGEFELTTDGLRAGRHTITLTGTDDAGETCEAGITVVLETDADRDGHPADTDCDDDDPLAFDDNGATATCPAASCLDILERGHSTGDGRYWLAAGATTSAAYEVECLMDAAFDGGGWTLTAVFSDDGQDTWTWNERHLLDTDHRLVGDLDQPTRDMKSAAYHDVSGDQVMFRHQPSGVWASYQLPTGPGSTLAETVAEAGPPTTLTAGTGLELVAGTLTVGANLNETRLYLSAADCDGTGENSYGPTWNASLNHACDFDDAGSNGVGPSQVVPDLETNTYTSGGAYTGVLSVGFGLARGLNTGAAGTGANHLQAYGR